jgi:hypothetical protein
MARAAEGDRGSCIDYVRNITVKLSELEIDDPAVDEIARALRQQAVTLPHRSGTWHFLTECRDDENPRR